MTTKHITLRSGDTYSICETKADMAEEVVAMGFGSILEFELKTGAVSEELYGKAFQLIHNRVYARDVRDLEGLA